jgi:O-antigen/teichoic acid export membrane protein
MSSTVTRPSEALVAAKNAVTLGSSLLLTAGMSLVIRLLIPRFLGPSAFGELRLAESFAEMLFVVLTFGVDMQLRREAALDATRARRYLSGLAVLRAAIGAAAIGVMVIVLRAIGSSDHAVRLFVLVAIAQTLLVLNNSYAALEHASGHVTWLARANFAAKLTWVAAMIAVLTQAASAEAIVLGTLAIEALRFAWFTGRAVRHHGLSTRPDLGLAVGAVTSSLPFFVNDVAHNLYGRIGTGWLSAVCGQVEVGLYGAAAGLASIALFGMPLLSWVLVPSTARAASNSDEERDHLVTGALRLALLVGVPFAVAFHLAAPLCLQLLVGPDYLAAAPVLRIMAPTVGLAYLSTVCAIGLIQRGRTWTVATISLAGVALTALFNALLIPWGARTLGAAGGAQGAAWATLATEILVTLALGVLNRASWLDGRLLRTAVALVGGLAAVVTAIHMVPAEGVAPFAAGLAAFATAVIAIGGVDRDDLAFCRNLFSRTRHQSPGALVPEAS